MCSKSHKRMLKRERESSTGTITDFKSKRGETGTTRASGEPKNKRIFNRAPLGLNEVVK
jgi:hypothetical protein